MKCKGQVRCVDADDQKIDIKGKITLPVVQYKIINVKGTIEFDDIKTQTLRIKGKVKGENISAEKGVIRGKVVLKKYKGKELEIEYDGDSSIDIICVDNLKISESAHEGVQIFSFVFGNISKTTEKEVLSMRVNRIQVKDSLELHGGEYKEIICKNIEAENCKIEFLKYSGNCKLADTCIVNNKEQI